MTDHQPTNHERRGRRRAVVLTTTILFVVLALLFAFALTMTRRLIDTWAP